jgi:putative ABC transport system permease protein
MVKGTGPEIATLAGFFAGLLAGFVTGLIHTKLGVNDLLSGILVMTAMYSVNLRIMNGSNLPMSNESSLLQLSSKTGIQLSDVAEPFVSLLILIVAFRMALAWFMKTDYGMSLRATGDNAPMALAQGIDTHWRIIVGLGLANGLAALSGSLVAQYQGFVDVSMGIGSLVVGIASVILGETIFGKRGVGWVITVVVLGSILFRLMVAFSLKIGVNPNDLRLLTATFVLVAMAVPALRQRLMRRTACLS